MDGRFDSIADRHFMDMTLQKSRRTRCTRLSQDRRSCNGLDAELVLLPYLCKAGLDFTSMDKALRDKVVQPIRDRVTDRKSRAQLIGHIKQNQAAYLPDFRIGSPESAGDELPKAYLGSLGEQFLPLYLAVAAFDTTSLCIRKIDFSNGGRIDSGSHQHRGESGILCF